MMTPRYMLDTNICIYIRQKRPTEILNRFTSLCRGDAVISVITFGELRYGAEKSRERERAIEILEEFVRLVPVEPMPFAAATAYGSIRANLVPRHRGFDGFWVA